MARVRLMYAKWPANALALVLCAAAGEAAGEPATAARVSTVVRTDAGTLRGGMEPGVRVFRGIPYAAPPVGALRFQPPAAPAAWAGTRDALDFMPACPQLVERDPTENGNSVMAEDCLGLNVWTPAAGHARRPVLVFIHGGAFIEGSARNTWYDGALLARRGGIVVVTIQYRIGALGFLELARVGGDAYAASGNLGILDQVAALQWVQRNIAAFGGDPANVTVAGESVGATSVAILMSLPRARGLFHKAILESNSGIRVGHGLAQADAMAREFMRVAGASSVEELQRMRWQDLRDAQARFFESAFGDSTFGPTWDGTVITEPPLHAIQAGRAPAIPVLLGTNLEEVRYWSAIEGLPLESKPRGLLRRQVAAIAGERADAIVDTYVALNGTYGDALLQLETDALWRMPAIRMAESLCQTQPVYMYLFTHRSTAGDPPYGAAHAMELPFVFGGLDAQDVIAFTGRAPHREALARAMQSAWIGFVRTGDPGSGAGVAWPRYELSSRSTLELGAARRVLSDPFSGQRRAWDGVPFDNLVPDGAQATALLSDNSDGAP